MNKLCAVGQLLCTRTQDRSSTTRPSHAMLAVTNCTADVYVQCSDVERSCSNTKVNDLDS
jgi:hypothetical protein